jgi:putative endonuclease
MWVYVLASTGRRLYIGVTNDLFRRWWQHRHASPATFVGQYRIHRLVYFEEAATPSEAIAREKQLKRWRRSKKVELVSNANPTWVDRAEEWGWLDALKADPSTPRPSRPLRSG